MPISPLDDERHKRSDKAYDGEVGKPGVAQSHDGDNQGRHIEDEEDPEDHLPRGRSHTVDDMHKGQGPSIEASAR